MRRRLRIIIGGGALLGLAYAVSPYWAGWQLRAAMKSRDTASLEARVDWTALRAAMKPRAVTAVDQSAKDSGGVTGYLKRVIGSTVAEKGIDLLVTPTTLARVLAGREFVTTQLSKTGISKSPPAPTTTPVNDTADPEDPDDPVPPRRVRYAFFDSPTRFRVEAVHPRLPGQRIVARFGLQGLRWKLVDIDITAAR